MTDLTDRLAALGVTLPDVDAYQSAAQMHFSTAVTSSERKANFIIARADAALAAVVGLLEDARHHNWVESQTARKATKRAEKAEAENTRLRVCGTCRHMGDTLCWATDDGGAEAYVEPHQTECLFLKKKRGGKSRWTPYWEEP